VGLNVVASSRRKNEESFWSFIPRQFNLYRLSVAGELAGLTVPTRRIQTVTPYVLTAARRTWPNQLVTTRYPSEVGGEIKYGVTPALTLDLTYNTDFAQVGVDDQRVNLTRFPIFFPEKRPFFLENAGTFSAGTPQAIDLFFTRRIGIDENGAPQQILGGGRLSGRIGGTTVGLLQMVTDAADTSASGQSLRGPRHPRTVGAFPRRRHDCAVAVDRDGAASIASPWMGDSTSASADQRPLGGTTTRLMAMPTRRPHCVPDQRLNLTRITQVGLTQ
jgi:hypothetical protein